MENITLSADEHLIEVARRQAETEQTTLDELFCTWLADYVQRQEQVDAFEALMVEMKGKARIGRKLTRDELNER